MKDKKLFRVSEKLRENTISRIKEILESRDEILLAMVFGSFVEKEYARDVDIAVYLAYSVNEFKALEYSEKLSREIEKKIGLLIDVIVLNNVDEGILMRAILKGRKLLVRDSILYHKLRMLALEIKNNFLLKHKNRKPR